MTDVRPPAPARAAPFLSPWTATLLLVGVLTAVRVALLFASRLELYPDEAQYWLWSRRLAFGYFSKPPAIAWLIAATTGIGGDAEPWVRICAPVLHGVAALALARAATRFYDARTGFWAATLYALMPGVQLSSEVIATDAPLLAALGFALWALSAMWTTARPQGLGAAAALGAALGLACLCKYAALYMVLGLAVHAVIAAGGRRRLWSGGRLLLATAVFLVVVSPNLAWNVTHHFQTLAHTVADADVGDPAHKEAQGFDLRGPLGFALGQFGVFGPAPFAVLLAFAVGAGVRRRIEATDLLLLVLAAPPILVVLVEAALVRANANWAAAAYVAGAPLVAAVLLRAGGRGRIVLLGGLALQAATAAVMAAGAVAPDLVRTFHADNALKRARGWRETAAVAQAHVAASQRGGTVTALAVDDRFLFNALSYYGRGWLGAPGAPPLRMWRHESRTHNQAEASSPLTLASGARVAFVSTTFPIECRWDFRRVEGARETAVALDPKHARTLLLFVGEGFAPRPRDPRTGLPIRRRADADRR